MNSERKGPAAVAWMKGTTHRFYEDRFRILTTDIPLVARQNRGEIFAVFDGIGSAPKGMNAAQEVCDHLLRFYKETELFDPSPKGMEKLLMEANAAISGWGMMPGTNTPLGGCAGTVAWTRNKQLTLFHAGDTMAVLLRDGKPRLLTHSHEVQGGIYKYFGLGSSLEISSASLPLVEGDLLILATDGVTKAIHPFEAAMRVESVINKTGDIALSAQELTVLSRRKGSHDDITVLVFEIQMI